MYDTAVTFTILYDKTDKNVESFIMNELRQILKQKSNILDYWSHMETKPMSKEQVQHVQSG